MRRSYTINTKAPMRHGLEICSPDGTLGTYLHPEVDRHVHTGKHVILVDGKRLTVWRDEIAGAVEWSS